MKRLFIILIILCPALIWAATAVKISELPSATSTDGSELLPVVQGGTTKQATVSIILANFSTATQNKINGKENTGTAAGLLANYTGHQRLTTTAHGGIVSNATFITYTGKTAAKTSYTTSSPFTANTVQGAIDQIVSLFRKIILTVFDIGTCTSTAAINPANGKEQKITLGADCTGVIQVGATDTAQELFLRVNQPATGHKQFFLKYSAATKRNVKWPSGTVPTFTNTSSAQDAVACRVYADNVICNISQDLK